MQKEDKTCKILTDDDGRVCHFKSNEEAIKYLESDSGSDTLSKLHDEGYTNAFVIVNPVEVIEPPDGSELFKTYLGDDNHEYRNQDTTEQSRWY